ncbi:MAG TPA: glycosyltransferase family 2 protein [Phnomibacter sp.]|nr:glycosyltransferase family 2 protein [Phnomibacter sp.]
MKLSILIRNLNEAENLQKTLLTVQKQQVSFEYEVVVVDNESTDNSVQIARQFGCKVVTLPRQAFTFGRAINVGVQHCSGEVVLLLSSHILLLTHQFLEQLVSYFTSADIAFVRPVNIAMPKSIEASLNPSTISLTDFKGNLNELAAKAWVNLVIANCTAISKKAWLEVPFNEEIMANEDKLWSLLILRNGWKAVSNVPCYYYYTKKVTATRRMDIDLKEEYSKAEILGKGPYKSHPAIQMMKSIYTGFVEAWAAMRWNLRIGWKLSKMKRITKSKYL